MNSRKKHLKKLETEEKNKMKTSKITADRINKFLDEGKRFDGRTLEEFREISVETGVSKNAEGSARVKLGKTEVLVGIKMNMGEPYPDSPNKGNLMVTAELLPLSSPRFESGPPKFPAIELGRVMDRVVRESKFIDTEKLCVKEGEKVWTVFIDIYSINDDGNLFDAASMGIIAALKTAKLPKYDEETGKVLFGEFTDKGIPLSKETPLSLTYYKIGKHWVIDPTREEEDIANTRITMGSADGTMHSMQKGGTESITPEEMNNVLDLNDKVWGDIFKRLEKFIK